MHSSIILSSLSICSILFLTTTCFPKTQSHPSRNHNAAPILEATNEVNSIEVPPTSYDQPPNTPNPPTNPLSIRSANTTNPTLQGRRTHIAYLDFSFLIWSDAHTHLLKTMTASFRAAATSAANDFALGVKTGAEAGVLFFSYGAFVLMIYYVNKNYLIDAILEAFASVLEAMYPVTYSLVWCGLVTFICYLDGNFDGKHRVQGLPEMEW